MKLPMEVNIFNYKVCDEDFIYDCDTGFITQSTGILNEIIKLLPTCTEKEIYSKLSNQFSTEMIKDCLNQLSNLYDKGYIFDCSSKYMNKTPNYFQEEWENGDLLVNLWLNISHDCNLRCIYCFGNGGSYGGTRQIMTKEVSKLCVDYWFKYLNKNASEATVTFFGGEPLMNIDVLEFSINYINQLLKDFKINIKYLITTNGTILNNRLIRLFKENDINFTISIDGGEVIQNKNRPYASGKGTFNVIKENVSILRKYYDTLSARMTLTHENILFLKDAVIDLWDIGFTDVIYEVVTIDDDRMSITNEDIELLRPQIKELNEITYHNMVNKSRKFFANCTRFAGFIHNVSIKNECSFQSPYTIMFTPEGNIFKCHRMMDNKDRKVGNLKNGINWNKFSENTKKYVDETECKSCWAKRICGGGCAQENYIYTGDYSKPYKTLCNETKMLAEESLKFYSRMYLENNSSFKRIFLKG